MNDKLAAGLDATAPVRTQDDHIGNVDLPVAERTCRGLGLCTHFKVTIAAIATD
jgi:hypothetical protein